MSKTSSKRVAVLGAGASGLIAIKCCLDEGLEPVCFERGTDIGGLWNYHEDIREGHASVFRSTVINTSKEIMSFSDFPAPKEFPNYMHNTWVMKYFRLYAEHFGLMKYINFKVHIDSVKPSADYDATGKWDVEYTDKEKDTSKTATFDAVLVCTGHHVDPHVAKFPGQDDFQGRIVHSHDYKHSQGYVNKRVVVIGIGNSGCDAAVDLARVASQVFLSTRRGSWILNRLGPTGLPVDIFGITRYVHSYPLSVRADRLQKRLNAKFDHARYGLQPKHNPTQQHPTMNDILPNEILSGLVKVKANVKCFLNDGVEFEDGTVERDIHEVIMATGYNIGFPFLDESIVKVTNNEVTMYKYVFPPHMKHGTLAVIGLIQPIGAINPISELQCRWATRVFKGLATLPTQETMMCDIKSKRDAMASRYVKSQRHTIQVDFIPYMDEIGAQIGVKPNFLRLLLTNPKLAYKCFFGPYTPYQYRLMGPGEWPGAKGAIEAVWDRILCPIKTRHVDLPEQKSNFSGFLKFLIFVVMAVAVIMKYFI